MEESERKAAKKQVIKGGLPAFRCYSLTLVDTQKLVDSWGKLVDPLLFFLRFLHFLAEIDEKSCFSVKQKF